jgi:hypothetical protein
MRAACTLIAGDNQLVRNSQTGEVSRLAHYLAHSKARKCKSPMFTRVLDGGSEWGSNPPVTGLPAARRF